jgi:DNA-binding MarR family transcriptional regulator
MQTNEVVEPTIGSHLDGIKAKFSENRPGARDFAAMTLRCHAGGISGLRLTFLLAIAEFGPIGRVPLARALEFDVNLLITTVDALQKAGWVQFELTRSGHNRGNRICLTASGRAILDAILPVGEEGATK